MYSGSHMAKKELLEKTTRPFSKYTNFPVIIGLSLFALALIELVTDSNFFYSSGLVHLFPVLLVLFIIINLVISYPFKDKLLKGFLHIHLFGLAWFGVIHIYEYIQSSNIYAKSDLLDMSVVLGYLFWIVLTIQANERCYGIIQKTGTMLKKILRISTLVLIGIAIVITATSNGLAEETIETLSLASVGLVWIFGVAAIFSYSRLKRTIPIFRGFSTYLTVAVLLVMLAAGFEFLEPTGLLLRFGILDAQVVYLSNAVFLAALSALGIGFGRLVKLPGVYKDL